MTNILENRSNYIIIKEYNLIKLYSYKSLVSIYNLETKIFEDIPYTYRDVYGNSCSRSKTTTRHQNKFKKFIDSNF